MKEKRPYRMDARARARDETRRRIVEATMRLHEEVGPRATTISAIAERAGVQRLTVYRHFPDETAVFQACTAHWLALNPPPDPGAWATAGPAGLRLRQALGAFYGYYGRTRKMWAAAHRDVAAVPALHGPMAAYAGHVAAVADDLAAAFDAPGDAGRRLHATLRHALAFPTWADLDGLGLGDDDKVAVVGRWVAGLLAGGPAD